MKKEFRVKSKQDFSKVIKQGKQFKNSTYVLYVLKTENNFSRVGVAVSSKTGIAVNRNTAKRRLRAIADKLINYTEGNKDIVIIAKSKFLNNNHKENLESLKLLLDQTL